MPKRIDIKKIMIIGSGPIVIGQACEFDYSGTQAVRALKEEGYQVVLVNSNPATIMTDPEIADRTYIEPITKDYVEAIIERERPDALLSTMGGQTALNLALELAETGVLARYNCELIGANVSAIETAEDRDKFKIAMEEIGLSSAKSGIAYSVEDAKKLAQQMGYPLIIRPSRTLGGTGGGIIKDESELEQKILLALHNSPNRQILIEESLLGWKEIELEVVRDIKDNVVIVCGIENFDPMGVHTGDSITVAPIQTLTDKEYQLLRDAAIKVIRRIGVDTGGSNVQFALNPRDGRIIVIEMNPRVSRSSALASKATGFPIAKIAAKLAVGYTLDELKNDITKTTPACFEPSIDYVVVKIPRFNFEKFIAADNTLGTQMKSVGESMAFGRIFKEALLKALCSLEVDSAGFDREKLVRGIGSKELVAACARPTPNRLWLLAEALRAGASIEELYASSAVDPWFLAQMQEIVQLEEKVRGRDILSLDSTELRSLKVNGLSDKRLSQLCQREGKALTEHEIGEYRKSFNIRPEYKSVDTCAAEFLANTPYLYSSYGYSGEGRSEAAPSSKKKVIILGSGPNRIGQGIEFDYCCVHAVMALRDEGYEAIMLNCNPETVSTDYDISNRLYFEPLSYESVMEIVEREKPYGVIVQFGGQTPLKLSALLDKAGVPILGTSVDAIDIAEDRERFSSLINRLGLKQPENATARSLEQALSAAKQIGYPLMIRPSFVLGGRAMRVLHDEKELRQYIEDSVGVSNDRPVLLDHYLHNAIELDVDAVSDGREVIVTGVMEHIERAGIHSGDSSCTLPVQSLSAEVVREVRRQTKLVAEELKVVGLMNMQFAITRDNTIYILEVNPRASRTVPFVSKATGQPWAKIAIRLMLGRNIRELGLKEPNDPKFVALKMPVFPFSKFAGVDTVLGPEMKSTGEAMGIDLTFGGSFLRAVYSTASWLPLTGTAFISLKEDDKELMLSVVRELSELGFSLIATRGTANFFCQHGLNVKVINKVFEGSPHIVEAIKRSEVDLVINTPEGSQTLLDSSSLRVAACEMKIPTFTTVAAAEAVVEAMKVRRSRVKIEVRALQDLYSN